jgi:hypothetical protein
MISIRDLAHRLRIREHRARDQRDYGLADDLRQAIETLQRLEREAMFARQHPAGEATRKPPSRPLTG